MKRLNDGLSINTIEDYLKSIVSDSDEEEVKAAINFPPISQTNEQIDSISNNIKTRR